MATKATMIVEINKFFDKIINLFTKTAGSQGQGLFYDNSEGTFSFKKESLVPYMQIATTANEVTGARAAIVANVAQAGTWFVDATALQIQRYDQPTDTWSTTTADYYTYVRPHRVYYSPWNAFVWTVDKYGEFKRFMTTGLTLIG